MVGLTVEVGVPQFENPWSTLFKNLEFVNDVNTISWPNAVSSMNCGNNCKSVSKRQSVLIKVSCWLWECFETSVGLNKGFLLIIRVKFLNCLWKVNHNLYVHVRTVSFVRVRTRPKPSNFSGVRIILSMLSFGGEVKESVPCPSFAACKRT